MRHHLILNQLDKDVNENLFSFKNAGSKTNFVYWGQNILVWNIDKTTLLTELWSMIFAI